MGEWGMKRWGPLGVLLLALVLGNALMWVWGQGWLGGNPGSRQRDPARLAAQVQADRFQLLSPQAASAALQPLQCREIGQFNDEASLLAAEAAVQAMLKLPAGAWQRVPRHQPGQWLVATRAADSRADLERKRVALERADAKPLRTQALKGESESSWVVGRFDSEDAALAEQERLRRKGLKLLRVVPMRLPSHHWWLRLPGLDLQQLKAVHPTWPGGLRPCEATAPTAPL